MKKPLSFSIFIFCLSLISPSVSASKNIFFEKDGTKISVVVIDPGHGGKDYGASVGNVKEKDIVLDLALKLGNSIKLNYPEIEIIYTRTKDVFIPLYERANIANKNGADLFISIHVNAVEQTFVQGTETFVLGQHRSKENLEVAKKENAVILLENDYNTTYEGFDPNQPESYIMFELVQDEYLDQSVMFASNIQNQFRDLAKRIDRSVKQSGFLVLRQTTMPGVLIEAGFLSNASERKYMLSESGKTNLSASIFKAFEDYKKIIESKSSFNLRTDKPKTQANIMDEKTDDTKTKSQSENEDFPSAENIWFSVQIAASQKKLDPLPANFKGEKNIFRIDWKNISRYYSGKFATHEKAAEEKTRIQKKYPDAFIVAFENEEIISVKKALRKM